MQTTSPPPCHHLHHPPPPLSPPKPLSPPPPIFSFQLTSTPPNSSLPLFPPPTNAPPPSSSPPPLPPPPPLIYGVPPPPSNQVEIDKTPPPLQPPFLDIGVPPPPSPPSPPPQSPSGVPVGLIVGISVGVAGGFFVIALILGLFCYFRRSRSKGYNDCESPQKKDNFYDELPQQCMNKERPSSGGRCFKLPFKIVRSVSRVDSSSDATSNLDENSPKAQPGFGHSVGNFTYEELTEATNGFSTENLLGEGGFGYVHKGVLQDRTKDAIVAVKQLKEKSKQGDSEFQAEVETITRVHHRHLVSLVGFCIAGRNRLLVYEYVNNKTLHFHLNGKDAPPIDWPTRLKVAIGSAKGIAYLHEDCNPTIIHRDIKASNILIDSHFEAKVSDFGFAKEFSSIDHYVSHISTRVVGTFGYLAPEYAQSGQASDKSDVFSFGVILLELITGRPPILEPQSSEGISLVLWAKPLLKRALEDRDFSVMVDPRLQGNYNREEVANMAACAFSCVRSSHWRRPRMSQILRALEGGVSLADQDEGVRPGQSSIDETFNYDNSSVEYTSQFEKTFSNQKNARYSSSDGTNERFGFCPSSSSADAKRPPLQQDNMKIKT